MIVGHIVMIRTAIALSSSFLMLLRAEELFHANLLGFPYGI